MKNILLIGMIIFGLLLSWSMACFGDFYVIPVKKKNFAPVPKTGQKATIWAGDDGSFEMGIASPNPRFKDHGDGTVTDKLTGLMWLKDADCIQFNYPGFDTDGMAGDGQVTWQHAFDFVWSINAGTYPTCNSTYSDWRMPNIRELLSLIDFGQVTPAVSNTLGTGHWTEGDPFTHLANYYYWSSTTRKDLTSDAFMVHFAYGNVQRDANGSMHKVWPVRGGN